MSMLTYADRKDYNFDVGRERLKMSSGIDTGLDALYREDSGEFLSAVSPKYKVTTHKEANAFAEQLFDRAGLEYEEGHVALDNKCNRFLREFRFTNKKFSPSGGVSSTALDNDGAMKDDHFPTIILRNSYDKSSTLDFMFGGYRLVCSNGLIIGETVYRVKYRHTQEPDFEKMKGDVLMGLDKTIEDFRETYMRLNMTAAQHYMDLMLKQEILSTKMVHILHSMAPEHVNLITDKEGVNIRNVEVSNTLSAYALMQIVTEIASHRMRKYTRAVDMQNKLAKVFQ
ncbi:MAG: DUF945 domain-containing protein [Actinobacteria bacterium]|nr:DUF945 domain-containing protein [Actinomycetota bacterium]MCA1806300.1 DUF945 domain-containing protein [Actinomycetota bacterium]